MIFKEDEEIIQDPIVQIYQDVKRLMRGKVTVDYKDEFETVFGIILQAVVELKYKESEHYLSLRLYQEPSADSKENLSSTNQAQSFFLNFEHIFVESSEDISTLFSFYIVEPKENIEKVMLQNRNINDYKELLNTAIDIFNNNFGIKNGTQ